MNKPRQLALTGFGKRGKSIPIKALSSVSYMQDNIFLSYLIHFYFCRFYQEPKVILDLTWGSGLFWENSPWKDKVIGLDINPHDGCLIKADYNYLPIKDWSIDIIVFDPPYIITIDNSLAQSGKSPEIVKLNYQQSGKHNFHPVLAEIKRVLKPRGIAICKIGDSSDHWIKNQPNYYAHYLLMEAAFHVGLAVYDLLIKINPKNQMPGVQRPIRARKDHVFWIILKH